MFVLSERRFSIHQRKLWFLSPIKSGRCPNHSLPFQQSGEGVDHRKNGKGSEFKSNQEGDPTFHFQEYWEGRHKNKLESLEATLVQNIHQLSDFVREYHVGRSGKSKPKVMPEPACCRIFLGWFLIYKNWWF